MIDGITLRMGQHQILGCPYHGLVVGNRLTLPNGQHMDNQWNTSQVRGAYRLAVPGVPAITRTPEQAAQDAARGYQWRTDSVVWLFSNDPTQFMYGRKVVRTLGIYAAGMGNCWSVIMPFMASANDGYTALTSQATMAAIGRIGAGPDERRVTVELSGYGPGRFPPSTFNTVDSTPAGDRILGCSTLFYDPPHDMYTQGAGSLALIKCSGAGTPASPLRLKMEFVADQSSAQATSTDGFVLFDGVFEWLDESTVEWIPPKLPQADDCQWRLFRTTAYNLAYLPRNPDIPVPFNWVRYITGVRSASLDGYVLGGWLDADGQPVLVTCDIQYQFEASHRMNCRRSAQVDREQISRYVQGFDGCVLDGNWSDEQFNVAGVFESGGSYGATTIERIIYTLKVGGVTLDEYTVEHIFDETATLYGQSTPPGNGSASLTHTYTLKFNEAVVDQIVSVSPAAPDTPAFARNQLVRPLLDQFSRFGTIPVEQWLPTSAVAEFKLREVTGVDGTVYRPSTIVQVSPHWWSNNMVCLATRVRPWNPPSVGGGSRTYGPTAHPGGVLPGSITVNATASNRQPQPRFGARDPLSGTVIVGQTQRIQYV